MSVKLVYERPDIHDEFSAVKSITMELDDERTLDEMQEAFDQFLKAMSYNVPDREEDAPLTFGDSDSIDLYDLTGVADSYYDVNPDLTGTMAQDSYVDNPFSDYNITMDGDIDVDTGTITLDLSDRYGATTSKLKVD